MLELPPKTLSSVAVCDALPDAETESAPKETFPVTSKSLGISAAEAWNDTKVINRIANETVLTYFVWSFMMYSCCLF
jgi:hypothetical protein